MSPLPIERTERLPNFLIIGALKSGTNTLYQHLSRHPQVYMTPRNEPSYFAAQDLDGVQTDWAQKHIIRRWEDYLACFCEAGERKAIGEASPMYLVSTHAAPNIHQALPGVKLVAILRNPVDRAYSQWQMEVRNNTERELDFRKAIHDWVEMPDGTRRERYIYGGRYFARLKPYYELFGAQQMCVLKHSELQRNPDGLMRRLYSFLNVDPDFKTPDLNARFNEGGLPKSMFLFKVTFPLLRGLRNVLPAALSASLKDPSKRLKRRMLISPPALSPALRTELKRVFADDIRQLQSLTDLDLGDWL
jgi:hypothetical protein